MRIPCPNAPTGDFQMQNSRFDFCRPGIGHLLRVRPLVAGLAIAVAADQSQVQAAELQPWSRAVTVGAQSASALERREAAIARLRGVAPLHTGSVRPVTSCADDGSAGTLRAVVADAVSGDTIDLTALTCSTITLELGAIVITSAYYISFEGPGADQLTIDGNGTDRVMLHVDGTYGTMNLSGLTLRNGRATQAAGGVAADGGCIYEFGFLGLQDTVVTSCEASGLRARGGAISTIFAALTRTTVSDSLAEASQYSAYGGGVYAALALSMTSSTISGNRAVGAPAIFYSYGRGGGVAILDGSGYNQIATDTTISNNEADYGGGISTRFGSAYAPPFIIENSTISGNIAHRGQGGASMGGSVVLANSTIAFNQAGDSGSGGIDFGYTYPPAPAYLNVESSIIANNTVTGTSFAADLGALPGTDVTVTGSHNLIIDSSLSVPADTITLNPQLAPLADNGGPTWTHALLAGSPAIDAGSNTLNFEFDQRGEGYVRVIGPAADIGAFESPPLGSPDPIFASGFEGAAPL